MLFLVRQGSWPFAQSISIPDSLTLSSNSKGCIQSVGPCSSTLPDSFYLIVYVARGSLVDNTVRNAHNLSKRTGKLAPDTRVSACEQDFDTVRIMGRS
jgi:hypothetical protein